MQLTRRPTYCHRPQKDAATAGSITIRPTGRRANRPMVGSWSTMSARKPSRLSTQRTVAEGCDRIDLGRLFPL
jgi:hypothetical protein